MSPEGGQCSWCKGEGSIYIPPDHLTCGWCDGTGVQKPNFHGHFGDGCEHRTAGPIRAWCLTCSEWCYAGDDPAGVGCARCRLDAPRYRTRSGRVLTDADIEELAREAEHDLEAPDDGA